LLSVVLFVPLFVCNGSFSIRPQLIAASRTATEIVLNVASDV